MTDLKEYRRRARFLIREAGVVGLLRRSAVFLFDWFFKFQEFCIYLHHPADIKKFEAADFAPKVDEYEFKIVRNNLEADELEEKGFRFRDQIFKSRDALQKGGVAFLVFIDGRIASINWLAFNPRVQHILGEPPVKIDFKKGESITAGAMTLPAHRGKGLFAFTMFKTRKYLAETGIVRDWGLTVRSNLSSRSTVEKFKPAFLGYGYLIRILGFEFWAERKTKPGL